MANPWFRMYAEIRRDPKVKTMPEAFQLRLIWLFTLRCEGPTENLSHEELLYGLDCDETLLERLHETFQAKGFIEKDWSVKHWMKRQYVSDCSTGRVHKFREKQALKHNETFQKRRETQNETDQNRPEQKKLSRSTLEEIYLAYPRHVGKEAALKAIEFALRKNGIQPPEMLERVKAYAKARAKEDPQFTPYPATWFNQGRYYDDNLKPQEKLIWEAASAN